MSFARVAYPAPPPTSNTLTMEERNQLMRSTKKLGKVLGSMPRVNEGSSKRSPMHVSLSIVTSTDEKRHLQMVDNPASSYSPSRSPSAMSNSTTSSESTDSRSSISSATSVSSFADSVNSSDSWRVRKVTRKPPPLLRLASGTPVQGPPSAIASVKPTLETIPASPPFDATSNDRYSLDSSRHSPKSISFAAFGPPRVPTFEIPSDDTLRWTKMERLRRKLGDDVPAELVFPSDEREHVGHAIFVEPRVSGSPLVRSSIDERSCTSLKDATRGSSFSLQRPILAVVESDDFVSGCFDFGTRKHRAAYMKEFGRRS